MSRSIHIRSILCALVLFCSADLFAQVIAPTGAWVVDQPDLLTPAQERELSADLARYEEESSTQIVVVILNSLNGQDAGVYATELGQKWGVGQDGQDNGIVLLVSSSDRKMFIATGYGVEASVTDAQAGRIIRDTMAPRFRNGQFYDGIRDATEELVAATSGEFQGNGRTVGEYPSGGGGLRLIHLVIILIVLIVLVNILLSKGRDDNDPFDGNKKGRKRKKRRRRGSWGGGGPVIIWGGGGGSSWGGGGGFSSGGGGFSGGFGGFSGGGGGFGGGGAGGGW